MPPKAEKASELSFSMPCDNSVLIANSLIRHFLWIQAAKTRHWNVTSHTSTFYCYLCARGCLIVWVGLRVCLWREYICIGTVVMSLLLCKVEWPEQLQVQIPFPSCRTASTGGTTRSHTADLEHKVCVCLRLAKHGTLYSFLKSEV